MNILEPEDKPKGLNDSVVSSKHQVNKKFPKNCFQFYRQKIRWNWCVPQNLQMSLRNSGRGTLVSPRNLDLGTTLLHNAFRLLTICANAVYNVIQSLNRQGHLVDKKKLAKIHESLTYVDEFSELKK